MNDALGFPQRVVAIVQARMGSDRLPGKMMMDLGGKPLLAHVIDRLKLCKTLKSIVVATPDEEIARYAYSRGVLGYQDTGDPNNVLLRYIKAGGWCNAQIIVRVCGDSPFISPPMIDVLTSEYLQLRQDLVTNVARRTFPKGLDAEVLHYNTLKRIYHLTNDPLYLEHVTLFCYENPALFRIKNVSDHGRDYSFLNMSVDCQRDLDNARKMVSRLDDVYAVADMARIWEDTVNGRGVDLQSSS